MGINVFKSERDALAFLGLMSHMYKTFDEQFIAPDGEKTHTNGLNIQALLIDNATGTVLGMQKNSIHSQNNPLLHAEQMTLREAIQKKNELQPRNPETTSVENYYRRFLFNDPDSTDKMKKGATIYTTLEPCPFCTAALLVSRVKRIVFITPDKVYGNIFYTLWSLFYKKYDIHYEQMVIEPVPENSVVSAALKFFNGIADKVKQMEKIQIPGTLYFDTLKNDLNAISDYFKTVTPQQLTTLNEELVNNTNLLADIRNRI